MIMAIVIIQVIIMCEDRIPYCTFHSSKIGIST